MAERGGPARRRRQQQKQPGRNADEGHRRQRVAGGHARGHPGELRARRFAAGGRGVRGGGHRAEPDRRDAGERGEEGG